MANQDQNKDLQGFFDGIVKEAMSDSVSGLEIESDGRLKALEGQAQSIQGDRAARILRMAGATGIDASIIDRNLDDVEKLNRENTDWSYFRKHSPRLYKWLSDSPHHIAVLRKDIDPLSDLEKVFFRKSDPLRPLTEEEITEASRKAAKRRADRWEETEAFAPLAITGLGGGGFETRKEAEAQFFREELDERRSIEERIAGTGRIGFVETAKAKAKRNPLFVIPFLGSIPDFARSLKLKLASDAYQAGEATEEDVDVLNTAARLNAAEQRRGGENIAGMIASGLMELPAFIGEFASTAGIYSGVKSLALKGAQKGAEGIFRKTFASVLGAAAQTPFAQAGRIAVGTVERQTPAIGITADEEGVLKPIIGNEKDGFLKALGKSTASGFVEILSERTGFVVEKLAAPLKRFTISKWLKLHPDDGVTGFTKVLERTGWNGVLGEVFEERVGEVGRAALGVEPYKPPTAEQLAAEFVTFLVPGGTLAAAQAVTSAERFNRNQKIAAQVAQAHHKFLTDESTILKEMEVFKTAPEILMRLREEQLKDTVGEMVYLPLESSVEYLKSKNIDPVTFFDALTGDPRVYANASKTGLVPVPRGRYEVLVATGEHGGAMNREVRDTPTSMNAREAEEYIKEREKAPETKELSSEEQVLKAEEDLAQGNALEAQAEAEGIELPETVPDVIAEVETAQLDQELTPMIEDAQAAGMTEKQALEYAMLMKRVRVNAQSRMLEGLLDVERRKAGKDWQVKREQVEDEITRLVSERNDIIALEHLQHGRLPDGQRIPEEARLKLSKQAVTELYGPEVASKLPDSMYGPKGVAPDLAAELFGFGTADDFMAALGRPFTGEATPASKEAEIRNALAKLQAERIALETKEEPLEAESKAVTKEALAGKQGIASRIEKALRKEERDAARDLRETLQEIKDRGGVKPTVPTELLPKKYKAKKGAGVNSDELAQEFYDRGRINVAFSDDLYDWISNAEDFLAGSKYRLKKIEGIAEKLAASRLRSSLEVLEKNAIERNELRESLKAIRREQRVFARQATKGYRQALIDQLTEEAMSERFGLEPNDVQILERATQALHGVEPIKLMRRELEYMVSEQFSKFMKLAERVIGEVPTDLELEAEARRELGELTFRNLDPRVYQAAERDASRESRKAFKKGDFQKAVKEKRRQMFNHAKFTAAIKARQEFEKAFSFLKRANSLESRKRLGKAKGNYLEAQDTLLGKIELRRISPREMSSRESLRDWIAKRKEEDPSFNPVIPEKVLNDAYRKNYTQLTLDEMASIEKAVRNIQHLAKMKNAFLSKQRKLRFEDTVKALIESGQKYAKRGERTLERQSGIGKALDEIVAHNINLSAIVRGIDGFRDGGSWWESILRPLNEAANREATMNAEATKAIGEIFKKYSEAERIMMSYKKIVIPEIGQKLNREQLISMALNWGNLDSRQKLVEGIAAWIERPVTEQTLKTILDRELTPKDWKTVQEIWDYVNTYWPQIKALAERIDGIAPEQVEAAAFETPAGTLRGGYYPLKYDGERGVFFEKGESADEQARRMLEGAFVRVQTKHGHREERVKGVRRVVRLDLGVLSQHLGEVIHDLTHFEAISDINRLLRDPEIAEFIKDYHGNSIYRIMNKTLSDIAGGGTERYGLGQRVLGYLRRGTTTAILGFKVSTALLQPLGLSVSAVRVGYGPIAKAAARFIGKPHETAKLASWVFSQSELLRNRSRTFQRDINDIRNKLRLGRKAITKYQAASMWLTAKAQLFADTVTWLGAYEKGKAQAGKPGSAADIVSLHERAVALADQAVLDSQGGGQVKDLAAIQRGREELRIFTMFINYFMRRNEIAREAFSRVEARKPSTWFKLAMDMIVLFPLPTAATFLMRLGLRGGGDQDEEQLTLKLAKEMLSDTFAGFAFVREPIAAIEYGRSYRGPAGLKWIVETGDFGIQALQAIDEEETDEAFWRSLSDFTGPLLHLPTAQLEATIRGFMAQDEDNVEPGAVLIGPPRLPR